MNDNTDIKYKETLTIDIYGTDGLPGTIHAGVIKVPNRERYEIVLNEGETDIQQLAAFLHEIVHIYNHDHDSGVTVQKAEARTHKQLIDALELLKQRESEG